MVQVLMFGVLQQAAGWRERRFEVGSLETLRAVIRGEDPELADRLAGPGVFAVVNQDMVRGDHSLGSQDEVAFVPPVSGG